MLLIIFYNGFWGFQHTCACTILCAHHLFKRGQQFVRFCAHLLHKMALVQYQRNRNVNNKYKPINLFYDIFLLLSHCALEILPDRFVNQTNYPENFSDRFVCLFMVCKSLRQVKDTIVSITLSSAKIIDTRVSLNQVYNQTNLSMGELCYKQQINKYFKHNLVIEVFYLFIKMTSIQ